MKLKHYYRANMPSDFLICNIYKVSHTWRYFCPLAGLNRTGITPVSVNAYILLVFEITRKVESILMTSMLWNLCKYFPAHCNVHWQGWYFINVVYSKLYFNDRYMLWQYICNIGSLWMNMWRLAYCLMIVIRDIFSRWFCANQLNAFVWFLWMNIWRVAHCLMIVIRDIFSRWFCINQLNAFVCFLTETN